MDLFKAAKNNRNEFIEYDVSRTPASFVAADAFQLMLPDELCSIGV